MKEGSNKKLNETISTIVGIKKEMSAPLRAVILDNDETTGSYGIVFAIIITLKHFGHNNKDQLFEILIRLARWMNAHHCFRPGLVQLLHTLISLRRHKKIDAVIMYTNQKEAPKHPSDDDTQFFLNSIPECIAFMMTVLVGEKVFDHILTRPHSTPVTTGHTFPKHFHRVLNLYPEKPKDIRDIVFVDDLAYPAYILADSIPRCNVEKDAWYPVDPYFRVLTQEEIFHCLEFVFGNLNKIEAMVAPIVSYVLLNQADTKNSIKNASVFINLTCALHKKYGWAPKRSAHLNQFVPIQPEVYDAKTEE